MPNNKGSKYEIALKVVRSFEGGYVDDPMDRGGPTNYGITQAVYDAWRASANKPTKPVRSIEEWEADSIYQYNYWDRVRGDDIRLGLALCLFDFAVHSGVARSVKTLQRILGVKEDGVMAIITLRAIEDMPPHQLIDDLIEARLAFMRKLKTWSYFKNGWQARIERLQHIAHEYVEHVSDEAAPDMSTIQDVAGRATATDLSIFRYRRFWGGAILGSMQMAQTVYVGLQEQSFSQIVICTVISLWVIVFLAYVIYAAILRDRDN